MKLLKSCVAHIITLLFLISLGALTLQSAVITERIPGAGTLIFEAVPDKGIVMVDLWIRVGAIDETPAEFGAAHFLEHLIFKGNPQFPKEFIDRFIARVGADFNGATARHFTHFYILGPKEYFDTYVNILSSIVFHPAIDTASLETERGVILSEMKKNEDDPDHFVFQRFVEKFFNDTRLAHPFIGYESTVRNLTASQLQRFHRRYLSEENVYWIVLGDVKETQAKQSIAKYSTNASATREGASFTTKKQRRHYRWPRDVFNLEPIQITGGSNFQYKVIGFPVTTFSPERAAAYDLLASYLSYGRASVLYNLFVRDNTLYFIDTFYVTTLYPSYFAIFFGNPKKEEFVAASKVLAAIKKNIDHLNKSQFDLAQSRLANDFIFDKENLVSRAQLYGFYATQGLLDFGLKYMQYLEKIKLPTLKKYAQELFTQKYKEVYIK